MNRFDLLGGKQDKLTQELQHRQLKPYEPIDCYIDDVSRLWKALFKSDPDLMNSIKADLPQQLENDMGLPKRTTISTNNVTNRDRLTLSETRTVTERAASS